MKAAQKEIRSTVTVNTIDLGSKKREEDSDLMALGPRMRGEDLPGSLGDVMREGGDGASESPVALSSSCFLGFNYPSCFQCGLPSIKDFGCGVDPKIVLQDQTELELNLCGSNW